VYPKKYGYSEEQKNLTHAPATEQRILGCPAVAVVAVAVVAVVAVIIMVTTW
jgi:ABC-type lipoprotein release transport system permease subunit